MLIIYTILQEFTLKFKPLFVGLSQIAKNQKPSKHTKLFFLKIMKLTIIGKYDDVAFQRKKLKKKRM